MVSDQGQPGKARPGAQECACVGVWKEKYPSEVIHTTNVIPLDTSSLNRYLITSLLLQRSSLLIPEIPSSHNRTLVSFESHPS